MVSIVIPVYNVEKYIDTCIKSVVSQTYSDIEIILVDDGSTDSSGAICDRYKSEDSRITVYHTENGGLSAARNYGIDRANGEYLTVVDSDDFVALDFIEYLYKILMDSKSDIAICDYSFVDEDCREYISQEVKEYTKTWHSEDALKRMLYQQEFTNSAWAKLYKISLFENIRYPYGKLFEDMGTTYKLIMKAKKVAFGSSKKYLYRQRADSIMFSVFDLRKLDCVELAEEMVEEISEKMPKIRFAAKARAFSANLHILLQIPDTLDYKEVRYRLYSNIKKDRFMNLCNVNTRVKNKASALISFFGLNVLYKIGNGRR